MTDANLRKRNAKIIKDLNRSHTSGKKSGDDEPPKNKARDYIRAFEDTQYDLDQIDWALEILDDLRDDQGTVDCRWNQDETYNRISLVYFWMRDHVNSIKQRSDGMINEHYHTPEPVA